MTYKYISNHLHIIQVIDESDPLTPNTYKYTKFGTVPIVKDLEQNSIIITLFAGKNMLTLHLISNHIQSYRFLRQTLEKGFQNARHNLGYSGHVITFEDTNASKQLIELLYNYISPLDRHPIRFKHVQNRSTFLCLGNNLLKWPYQQTRHS